MASGLADVPSFSPDVCVFINTLVSQISLVPSPLAPPMSFRLGALVVRYRREIKRVECTEEMAPRGVFETRWSPLPCSVNFKVP